MAKNIPQLYKEYSVGEALVALGASEGVSLRCDGAFALLPRTIAWFVTLGAPPEGSAFTRPSVLAWKPMKGARARKGDDLPLALLGKVHLLVRARDQERFLYVGKTQLISEFRCDFETVVQVTPKLRRDVWVRCGGSPGAIVDVDGRQNIIGEDPDLVPVLNEIRQADRADVGINRYEEDWFHALFSGDRAFLMYLPEIGEAGMSSRDPKHVGAPNARVVFRSANGEDTEIPARFTVSKDQGLKAVEQFLRSGRVPKFIHWEDD